MNRFSILIVSVIIFSGCENFSQKKPEAPQKKLVQIVKKNDTAKSQVDSLRQKLKTRSFATGWGQY